MNAEKIKEGLTKSSNKKLPLAFVQDRPLAKDYAQLLEENGIAVSIETLPKNDETQDYETVLMVEEEHLAAALEAMKSKSPGKYFYSELFEFEELKNNDNIDED